MRTLIFAGLTLSLAFLSTPAAGCTWRFTNSARVLAGEKALVEVVHNGRNIACEYQMGWKADPSRPASHIFNACHAGNVVYHLFRRLGPGVFEASCAPAG